MKNNKTIDEFTVYVIDDNISEENKLKMKTMVDSFCQKIVFLDLSVGIKILEENNIPKYRNSYTTYLKLFTFNLLPDSVHRIFFIDSDTIVVGDLGELVDYDMNGSMIAAVLDGLSYRVKLNLGYSKSDKWFNMGVLLIDVDMWKTSNGQQKIMDQLKLRKSYFAVDQDLLNITQHGNIVPLHPKYNATPHHCVFDEKSFRRAFHVDGFYDDLNLMKEAQNNAVIRHFERFVGQAPWDKNSVHPYTSLFDEYLSESPWSDYTKKDKKRSFVYKIEVVLYKILPKNIFVYIYGIGFCWFALQMEKKMRKHGLKNIA